MARKAAAPKSKAKPKVKASTKPKRAASTKAVKAISGQETEVSSAVNDKPWQFKPGQSGNPGGMHKGVAEVKKLARQYTHDAINTLRDIMMDKDQNGSARVSAANVLLDRGYGKPIQQVEVGAPGDFAALDEQAVDAFLIRAQAQLKHLESHAFH